MVLRSVLIKESSSFHCLLRVVTTVDHEPASFPSLAASCVKQLSFMSFTISMNLLCYISLFLHTWQPYIRHSLSSISIFPPLHMSSSSQACFSNFVFKPLSCLSDVLIYNPVHPGCSQWKSSSTLPLIFLLVWHSPNQTSNQQIKLK